MSFDYRRRRLLGQAPPGPLHDYLASPRPDPDTDFRRIDYLALDLETTGLDAARCEILSFGYVSCRGTQIHLASARHRLIRPDRAISESSVLIHQITDDAAAEGQSLKRVLSEFLQALQGKVLIVHYAQLELAFLKAACEKVFGVSIIIPTVDTLWLARRRLERQDKPAVQKSLRLAALREHYQLPRYRAHDALSDALSAAELFMALAEECSQNTPVKLRQLLLPTHHL